MYILTGNFSTFTIRAWIATSTVSEFTASSMMDGNKFFNEKKFNSAKEHDYRCAVKEAMRIVSASGMKFPPNLTQMCAAWDDKEEPWIRPTKECCVKCEGTGGVALPYIAQGARECLPSLPLRIKSCGIK